MNVGSQPLSINQVETLPGATWCPMKGPCWPRRPSSTSSRSRRCSRTTWRRKTWPWRLVLGLIRRLSSIAKLWGRFFPTHRSYICVHLTDGAARIFCDSSLFASPLLVIKPSNARASEPLWERAHTVGRERKKMKNPIEKYTLPWSGFEPTDSVSRAKRSNHYSTCPNYEIDSIEWLHDAGLWVL